MSGIDLWNWITEEKKTIEKPVTEEFNPLLITGSDEVYIASRVIVSVDDIDYPSVVTGIDGASIEVRLSHKLLGSPYIFTNGKFERLGFICDKKS